MHAFVSDLTLRHSVAWKDIYPTYFLAPVVHENATISQGMILNHNKGTCEVDGVVYQMRIEEKDPYTHTIWLWT
jgi:hypothetical protein